MVGNSLHKYRKLVGRLCWVVVIIIAIIWFISQQITINKYEAEVAELTKTRDDLEERNSELATGGYELSEEEFERIARQNGYVRPDEVILRDAD